MEDSGQSLLQLSFQTDFEDSELRNNDFQEMNFQKNEKNTAKKINSYLNDTRDTSTSMCIIEHFKQEKVLSGIPHPQLRNNIQTDLLYRNNKGKLKENPEFIYYFNTKRLFRKNLQTSKTQDISHFFKLTPDYSFTQKRISFFRKFGDYIVYACRGNKIGYLHDLKTNDLLKIPLNCTNNEINDVAFNSRQTLLFCVGQFHKLFVYSIPFRNERKKKNHLFQVNEIYNCTIRSFGNSIDVSSNDKHVIIGTDSFTYTMDIEIFNNDKEIKISKKKIFSTRGDYSQFNCDSTFFLTCAQINGVIVFDFHKNIQLHSYDEHGHILKVNDNVSIAKWSPIKPNIFAYTSRKIYIRICEILNRNKIHYVRHINLLTFSQLIVEKNRKLNNKWEVIPCENLQGLAFKNDGSSLFVLGMIMHNTQNNFNANLMEFGLCKKFYEVSYEMESFKRSLYQKVATHFNFVDVYVNLNENL